MNLQQLPIPSQLQKSQNSNSPWLTPTPCQTTSFLSQSPWPSRTSPCTRPKTYFNITFSETKCLKDLIPADLNQNFRKSSTDKQNLPNSLAVQFCSTDSSIKSLPSINPSKAKQPTPHSSPHKFFKFRHKCFSDNDVDFSDDDENCEDLLKKLQVKYWYCT